MQMSAFWELFISTVYMAGTEQIVHSHLYACSSDYVYQPNQQETSQNADLPCTQCFYFCVQISR